MCTGEWPRAQERLRTAALQRFGKHRLTEVAPRCSSSTARGDAPPRPARAQPCGAQAGASDEEGARGRGRLRRAAPTSPWSAGAGGGALLRSGPQEDSLEDSGRRGLLGTFGDDDEDDDDVDLDAIHAETQRQQTYLDNFEASMAYADYSDGLGDGSLGGAPPRSGDDFLADSLDDDEDLEALEARLKVEEEEAKMRASELYDDGSRDAPPAAAAAAGMYNTVPQPLSLPNENRPGFGAGFARGASQSPLTTPMVAAPSPQQRRPPGGGGVSFAATAPAAAPARSPSPAAPSPATAANEPYPDAGEEKEGDGFDAFDAFARYHDSNAALGQTYTEALTRAAAAFPAAVSPTHWGGLHATSPSRLNGGDEDEGKDDEEEAGRLASSALQQQPPPRRGPYVAGWTPHPPMGASTPSTRGRSLDTPTATRWGASAPRRPAPPRRRRQREEGRRRRWPRSQLRRPPPRPPAARRAAARRRPRGAARRGGAPRRRRRGAKDGRVRAQRGAARARGDATWPPPPGVTEAEADAAGAPMAGTAVAKGSADRGGASACASSSWSRSAARAAAQEAGRKLELRIGGVGAGAKPCLDAAREDHARDEPVRGPGPAQGSGVRARVDLRRPAAAPSRRGRRSRRRCGGGGDKGSDGAFMFEVPQGRRDAPHVGGGTVGGHAGLRGGAAGPPPLLGLRGRGSGRKFRGQTVLSLSELLSLSTRRLDDVR